MASTVAAALLEVFGAREDLYAAASYDGSNVSYHPVKEPLTEEVMERHLGGVITVGAYQLSLDDTVRWLGWDIDAETLEQAQEDARRLMSMLEGVPYAVEFSGSKGYHLLIFLTEPMLASDAKELVDSVRIQAGLKCECFPKQAKLNPNQPFGNLLKVPLGVHPKTGNRSRFVDPANGWEGGQELDPLETLNNRVAVEQLEQLLAPRTPVESIVGLLTPHWQEGNRHDLSLALAGLAASSGWLQANTEDLITRMCQATGDTDEMANRLETVVSTYQRLEQGQPIVGYAKLSSLLPGAVMSQLMVLLGNAAAPQTVRRMDEVRARRLSAHHKVRLGEQLVWSDLSESGRFVKADSEVYYFDRSEFQLMLVNSKVEPKNEFQQLVYKRFGMNLADGFYKQIYHALYLHASTEAPLVPVHRRCYWDAAKGQLLVSLGGKEVYVLKGDDDIEVSHNGDCGVLFFTQDQPAVLPIEAEQPDKKWAWELLVDPASLRSSTDMPATPEQQKELMKAWVLSTLFPQLMPTKAILVCLGMPGSGKTTFTRRLVQVLEAWEEDVLEVATDKQDSLRTSLIHHHVIGLDNLERSGSHWLADMLNRASTGSRIELRRLYTTADVDSFRPSCFIILNGVEMPFSEETVFSRMLPLEFDKLKAAKPEHQMRSELLEHYNDIWMHLLLEANRLVTVAKGWSAPSQSMRLADFGSFCQLACKAGVLDTKLVEGGLKALEQQQTLALADNSPFMQVLEAWQGIDPDTASTAYSAPELMSHLRPLARTLEIPWPWKTGQAFARHLQALEPRMGSAIDAEITEAMDTRRGKVVKRYRFHASNNGRSG